MTKQIHNNACIRLNLKNNLKTCILRVSITFLRGKWKKEKFREKFIFPFVGSLQFVILSISVYTGIINRKSVFIGNKYLTVACHAEIRNPHSNCQCGTYQKTCQSVSGLYHPRRRLGDVLLTHLQMPKELMVNHLQHINNSLSCQEGKKTGYIYIPPPMSMQISDQNMTIHTPALPLYNHKLYRHVFQTEKQ